MSKECIYFLGHSVYDISCLRVNPCASPDIYSPFDISCVNVYDNKVQYPQVLYIFESFIGIGVKIRVLYTKTNSGFRLSLSH